MIWFRPSSAKWLYNLKCPSLKHCKHDQILYHSSPTSKNAFSVMGAVALHFFNFFIFTPICNHDHTSRCWAYFQSGKLGVWKQSNSFLSKHSERSLVFSSYRRVPIQNCGTRKRWHLPPYPFLTAAVISILPIAVCVHNFHTLPVLFFRSMLGRYCKVFHYS